MDGDLLFKNTNQNYFSGSAGTLEPRPSMRAGKQEPQNIATSRQQLNA